MIDLMSSANRHHTSLPGKLAWWFLDGSEVSGMQNVICNMACRMSPRTPWQGRDMGALRKYKNGI